MTFKITKGYWGKKFNNYHLLAGNSWRLTNMADNSNKMAYFEQNDWIWTKWRWKPEEVLLKNQGQSSQLYKISRKCLIFSSFWDYSFYPLMWSRVSVWHHFQAQRPQMYKQPSTPFRKSTDVPELLSLFTRENALFPL